MSAKPFIGQREHFPGIGRIAYEGPASDNPLAYKVYDAERVVAGRTMREHLRFSVCYWHTFCADGADPFGPGTRDLLLGLTQRTHRGGRGPTRRGLRVLHQARRAVLLLSRSRHVP